jgi:2-polyprenyl-3-methyl-5-hydroxy-6-metoxy-1,4-benzoquinol methylase
MRRDPLRHEFVPEPADAYDKIALVFSRFSDGRRPYLERIEQLILSELPPRSRSLLDIGAGDGIRSLRIAAAANVSDPVLLEPSPAMRSQWPPRTTSWPIRAEELTSRNGSFDVITCLWNVLGHIFPASARVDVLRNCRRLLAPGGLIFVDVSHRYNVLHYGVMATLLRILRDRIRPAGQNGDVTASWELNGASYSTNGHVFTDVEFRRLCAAAGLAVRKRWAVDYATGAICHSIYAGHLLYVLGPASTFVKE